MIYYEKNDSPKNTPKNVEKNDSQNIIHYEQDSEYALGSKRGLYIQGIIQIWNTAPRNFSAMLH